MAKIKIIKAGMLSTIQDLGRYGFQEFGMPVSGAMDHYSMKLANFLVGNNLNSAVIEATVIGPEIFFEADCYIAICGADMNAKLNNESVNMYQTISVKSGTTLKMGAVKDGFRTYIAFSGGIDVPLIMNSRSTYLRGKIGGHGGRQLIPKDELNLGKESSTITQKKIDEKFIPIWSENLVCRIIAGPEIHKFKLTGINTFLNSTYSISLESDRMGYRLNGERIAHRSSPDIISAGIAFGTIQVPGHGEPIIMMADHQTTGGYAKIANVISADLPYLAQMKQGDTIEFEEIKLEEAHELLQNQNKVFEGIK